MRVIAGSARGRPLRAPRSEHVRPTGDRVKEAMFSMLEAEAYKRGFEPTEDGQFACAVAWPRVLELYAGSGALTVEALSRGAEWADLVEPDAEARRTIAANLQRTGLEQKARVHALDAAQAVARLSGRYDLALLDPPYAAPAVPDVLARLATSGLLGPDSVIVLEHSRDFTPPRQFGDFDLARTARHGSTCVSLYTRSGGPA